MPANIFLALAFTRIFLTSATTLRSPYYLTSDIAGYKFYSYFNWQAIPDPTHGRVNYIDEWTSIKQNLTYADHDTFILRADYKTVLDPNGPGRDSVRIVSEKTYTTHVAVFDIRHMPQGCGTWPAIWETTLTGWPNGGEVDIVEGVDDNGPNAATLHTTAGCTMPETRLMTGMAGQLDCNCYGPNFNDNGGGWYAMERTEDHISIWFWARNDTTVPRDVQSASYAVQPDKWGTPSAYFPNTNCDLDKYFGEHNIIINLTLCGDWAGSVYGQSGCPSTCVDFVNNNPQAFRGAYFDFAGIRVYEPTIMPIN